METHRILHLRYKVDNYHFDAAIDIHYYLHNYENNIEKSKNVPIEIYNRTKPEWEVKVIFATNKELGIKNEIINQPDSSFCHTIVPFDFIIKETKKWIKENK